MIAEILCQRCLDSKELPITEVSYEEDNIKTLQENLEPGFEF